MRYLAKLYFVAGLVLLLGFLPTTVRGQACCTLQGFNGNAVYGSIADFDGLDFADAHNRTQLQFQLNGSDDWDRSSFIINGPLVGYLFSVNHFIKRNLLVGGAVSGNLSSISELLTIDQLRSNVSLHTFQLRANYFSPSRTHAFWGRISQPIVTYYSNDAFPFTLSPATSLEIGYGNVKHVTSSSGKPRIRAIRINIRKDSRTENLYEFNYYATGQLSYKFRPFAKAVPFATVYGKHGALKPVDPGVYQTNFPAALFAYVLVGGGFEYASDSLPDMIIRAYAFYPFLRWSNSVLPAGFEEKPVIGVSVSKSLSLFRQN